MGGGGGTKNGVHVGDIRSSIVLLFFTVDVRRAVGLAATAAAVPPDDRRVAGILFVERTELCRRFSVAIFFHYVLELDYSR
jgi:hypothetical protein